MKSTVLDPAYVPLIQKPFCCNATCLSMILYRRGFGLVDQEVLAGLLGVKISVDVADYFTTQLTIADSKNEELGINTIESAALVNEIFETLHIPLQAQRVNASEIQNLATFIQEELEANHDLWIEYKSHELHSEDTIHDNVIERIDMEPEDPLVTLIDPLPDHKNRFQVPVSKLHRAISTQFDRETGFLVISKQE